MKLTVNFKLTRLDLEQLYHRSPKQLSNFSPSLQREELLTLLPLWIHIWEEICRAARQKEREEEEYRNTTQSD